MDRVPPSPALDAAARAAGATVGLDLLIVFGSRARGDARPGADWDFGYLADAEMDLPGLIGALVEALGTDRVDVVDLDRASGLLRYRAACDGRLVLEAAAGLCDRFCLQAAQFWCDNAAAFEQGYEEVLQDLRS